MFIQYKIRGFNMLYVRDKNEVMERIGTDLDANLNFKVNSELKLMFDDICKKNQSNMAREIKTFMTKVVLDGKLGNGRDIVNF